MAGENTDKTQELKFQDWDVEIVLDGEKIRYSTHGDQIHQRKLGFTQSVGNCRDILYLEWSTWSEGTERFEGDLASIAFEVGETSFTLNAHLSLHNIDVLAHAIYKFRSGRIHDGIRVGVEGVNLADRGVDQFVRRDLALLNQRSLRGCIHPAKLISRGHVLSASACAISRNLNF